MVVIGDGDGDGGAARTVWQPAVTDGTDLMRNSGGADSDTAADLVRRDAEIVAVAVAVNDHVNAT